MQDIALFHCQDLHLMRMASGSEDELQVDAAAYLIGSELSAALSKGQAYQIGHWVHCFAWHYVHGLV